MRAADWLGTRRQIGVIQADGFFRFVSWFSPLAANASRWAAQDRICLHCKEAS